MRHQMENILKNELRTLAIRERDELNLTQRKMAEALVMSETSYSDIECGDNMCGTLTAILLIMRLDDPNEFIQHLKGKFKELYDREMSLL